MTDVDYHIQDLLLTFHRSHGINFVKGILLQNNEVNQFRFPENDVVIYRYTVITQNVDLFGNFFSSLKTGFKLILFTDPFLIYMIFDLLFKFRIFDIFGI